MRKYLLFLPLVLFSQTMTVYKDNIALVKEPLHWDITAGNSVIRYGNLPDGLFPESPFLTLDHATIRYQRFNNDVFNGEEYINQKIGEYVYIKIHDDKVLEGTLIESKGNRLSLKTRKEIMTINRNKVDYVYARDIETVPQLRPELIWDIYSPKARAVNGGLVYLSGGFDWNANYRLILNGEKGELISEAVVKNESNVDYNHYILKLVEGNLQKKGNRPQPVYRTNARSLSMEAQPVLTENELGDYHIYSLPGKISLRRNQSITVRLYEPKKVDIKKTYVFSNSERSKKEEPLQIEIQLKNTEENGLNIPLPQGKVTLYLQSPDGSLKYAGEDELKQVPKGETATISAGRAFDVIGKRTVLHYDRQRKSEEASIEITVKNIKDENVNIRLVERVHGDWVIRNASDNYIKKDASTVYFPFTVDPGGSKTVTYTYRKEWN